MEMQILQWNVGGLLHNLNSVKEHKYNPKLFFGQETHLKLAQTNFLGQYAVFRNDCDDANALSAGVAIVVDKTIACPHLPLQAPLLLRQLQCEQFCSMNWLPRAQFTYFLTII